MPSTPERTPMPAGDMMEICLLGPLQVSGRCRSTGLPGWRQRAVLAALALNANRVTTHDRLLDAVWGEQPPGTPRAQIQICVSGLRKLLQKNGCAARIITRNPGYVLEVDEAELDHRVFDRLVATARAHESAGRLEDAVSSLRCAVRLRRGPTLADVPGDAMAAAAYRLDEQFLAAQGDLVRIELALGRHQEIIAELRGLVAQHPLREELHQGLMLALFRADRQADALEVYQQARDVLAEQAGVPPSAALRRLAEAIRARDERLLPAGTAPAVVAEIGGQLPPGTAVFTARSQSLAEILDLLRRGYGDPAGFLPVVGLSGRPGVGKSCLAVQGAHILRESFPDGNLYVDLAAEGQEQGAFAALGQLLNALGVTDGQLPGSLRARSELYRARLTGQRVLVVLDGARREDDVMPLLPGVPGCGAIVTSRRKLTALPASRWLHLVELDHEESQLLLIRLLGRARAMAEREALHDLVRLCAGCPPALHIVAMRLISRPRQSMADMARLLADDRTRLDELSHGPLGVRTSFAEAYESLADDARTLFRRLGLTSAGDIAEPVASALLETDAEAGRVVAESLVDAAVLDVADIPPGGQVRYRLDPLLRLYARERLAQEEAPGIVVRLTRALGPAHAGRR